MEENIKRIHSEYNENDHGEYEDWCYDTLPVVFQKILNLTMEITPELKNAPGRLSENFHNDFEFMLTEYDDAGGGLVTENGKTWPKIEVGYDMKVFNIDDEAFFDYCERIGKKAHTPTIKRKIAARERGERLATEYDDFCNDPEIGDYVYASVIEAMYFVIAHEMAHCLQFWIAEPGFDTKDVHSLHNDVWKKYYRRLRRALGLVRR